MKRISVKLICLAFFLAILCPSLLSCGKKAAKSNTLYVYNWGEYISDGSEGTYDTNAEFEKWYFETYGEKVNVVYSTYSSNEDMYAKITGGAVNYDVIIPSDYMIERLIEEDQLLPLNYDNIPNAKNISPDFMGENAYYDKGNVYSVPYFYGMIGIIYNTSMVDEADLHLDENGLGSWDIMWSEKYKGNILQFNNSRDAFGTAQYKLGIDVNTNDESQWRVALEELKKQKNIVQGYVMDEIFNKMEGGSAAIAAYYAGDFLAMYDNNEDLDFFYPKNTNLYVDAMCIPKSAQNKELAEAYINFMCGKEAAVANAVYTYYASPNLLVRDDPEYIDELGDFALEKLYGTEGVNATPYKNLSGKDLALINNLWEELKSDIDVSPTIYILCISIVSALIFFALFFVIRKRIRNSY